MLYSWNPHLKLVYYQKEDFIVNADCFWNIDSDRQPSREGPPAGLGLGEDLSLIRGGRIEGTPASSDKKKLQYLIWPSNNFGFCTLSPFAMKLAQAWSDLPKFSDGRSLTQPFVSYIWTCQKWQMAMPNGICGNLGNFWRTDKLWGSKSIRI